MPASRLPRRMKCAIGSGQNASAPSDQCGGSTGKDKKQAKGGRKHRKMPPPG